MICKRVHFMPEKEHVFIDCYIAEYGATTRNAMLVIPGGGYGFCCKDREGDPIAEAFIPHNFNCFVLNYSICENAVFPAPLIEASLAVKYIKEHAEELKINPENVFCVGFSAGGHLAGSLATMWDEVDIKPYGINRVKGAVLCYPVLTATKGKCHDGSFQKILGKNDLTEEDRQKYSIENHVKENSSPVFMVATGDDTVVPCESSLYTALAYRKAKVPFELHIYKHGAHGFALGNDVTPDNVDKAATKWVKHSAEWAKNL